MIVIYGTASSGKSGIAEKIALDKAEELKKNLIYLATMETESLAAKERIKRHRALRKGKGFETIEEMYDPSIYKEQVSDKVVLLECMSNLCSNILYRKMGDVPAKDADINQLSEEICSKINELSTYCKELIIVTNNLFEDGITYDAWTDGYLMLLGNVNRSLAGISDVFIEVINGIPVTLKENKNEVI